jgi:DDE superfamily endonuclease
MILKGLVPASHSSSVGRNKYPSTVLITSGVPDKSIEKELREWNVPGCAQAKGWFDEGVGAKWIEQILTPYLQGQGTDALLMLDHRTCHVQVSFKVKLSRLGCDTDYIPVGYTCVLQPVDVGFNAPLKCHVKHLHHDWCIEYYVDLDPKQPFPIPNCRDIINWVQKAMEEISSETIRKMFLSIGYSHPEDGCF